MGLSTLHKRTEEENIIPAGVNVWNDGSLARVRRERLEKVCTKCGRLFKVDPRRSDRIQLCARCKTVKKVCSCGNVWNEERFPSKVSACTLCGEVYQGNKRGAVRTFSYHSRRRLMRYLAQLKKSVLPVFITLTFPDSWEGHRDPEKWKVTLKRFEARFRRTFPNGAYIWRQEVIDRKSGSRIGELSPHYHLLVFGVPYALLRRWVSLAWYECVNSGDPKHLQAGVQVSKVKTRRGIMRYASKTVGRVMSGELGKTIQTEGGSSGRWWGISIRDNFTVFLSGVKEYALSELEAVRAIRLFRRLAKLRGRDYPSLYTFIDGAWLILNLPRLVVPVMVSGNYRASGRPYSMSMNAYKCG